MSLILNMLDNCAPGYVIKRGKHNDRILYKGHFAAIPTGEHGSRDPEIQIGWVRNTVRSLGVDLECALKYIERLKG